MRRITMGQGGFSVVEVVLASAVLGLLVTALVGAYLYGQESTALAGRRARAVLVADEGLEALRNMRDQLYTNLSNGTHGLTTAGSQWGFSGTSDVVDISTRSLVLSAIDSRDNRRKAITESVTWQQNAQRAGTVSLETRLTNWLRNFANWSVATQAGFDLSGNNGGSEIALYITSSATYAVVLRASGVDQELYVVDVTNPAAPSVVGSLELGDDANDIAITGSNAVIASSSNAQELQVVSLATPASPLLVGSLDLASNIDAMSIAASGNNVFLGRLASGDPEVYSISISTPSVPTQSATLELGTDALKLSLAQNNQYLYVATPDNSNELYIVSASNPSSISVTGSFDASGNANATAVTAFSTYAVLGRDDGSIDIVQASTSSLPTLASSALDIGAQINDLSMGVGDIYVFAATNTAATPAMIVDVSTPATPALLGSVTMPGNARGIAWDFDLNRAFCAGTDNSTELSVMRPN